MAKITKAKITKANHYPDIERTVITVVLNPDDPESVHDLGTKDAKGRTIKHSRKGTYRTCHGCRYNHQVREFIWTGGERLKAGAPDGDGNPTFVQKDWDDYRTEVRAALDVTSRVEPAPDELLSTRL